MEEKDTSKKSKKLVGIVVAIIIALAVVVLVVIATTGKTTETGAYPASIKTGSIVCTSNDAEYPYTSKSEAPKAQNSTIRIIGTFNESKIIETVALNYISYYLDSPTATSAEAHMHAALGEKLAEDGFGYSEFDNNFSIIDKKVTLSLLIPKDKLTDKSAGYVLLPSSIPDAGLSIKEFSKNYESKGYKCTSTE